MFSGAWRLETMINGCKMGTLLKPTFLQEDRQVSWLKRWLQQHFLLWWFLLIELHGWAIAVCYKKQTFICLTKWTKQQAPSPYVASCCFHAYKKKNLDFLGSAQLFAYSRSWKRAFQIKRFSRACMNPGMGHCTGAVCAVPLRGEVTQVASDCRACHALAVARLGKSQMTATRFILLGELALCFPHYSRTNTQEGRLGFFAVKWQP